MTATAPPTVRARAVPAPTWPIVAVVAAGAALLSLRPAVAPPGSPASATVLLFLVLLVAGVAWPLPGQAGGRPAAGRGAALAMGMTAFALGPLLAGGAAAGPTTAGVIALNSLAAVAEEAFFRRLVYGALLPAGPRVAVAGSALLFAAVHLTVYGVWILPLDLAAGLVFAWQRQASGSWWVPAVTHVWANLLAVA